MLGGGSHPDGGGLVDHHQQAPVIGQLVVESTQTLLVVGKGLVKDLPPLPAQGRGPVLCLTDVNTDEDLDVLDIHLSCHLSLHGCRDSRWTTGPAPTPAKDLTHSEPFPLSAVTSAQLPRATFAPPGSSTDRGKTTVPTSAGPAPDHPGPPTR